MEKKNVEITVQVEVLETKQVPPNIASDWYEHIRYRLKSAAVGLLTMMWFALSLYSFFVHLVCALTFLIMGRAVSSDRSSRKSSRLPPSYFSSCLVDLCDVGVSFFYVIAACIGLVHPPFGYRLWTFIDRWVLQRIGRPTVGHRMIQSIRKRYRT